METVVVLAIMALMTGATLIGMSASNKATANLYADQISEYINGIYADSLHHMSSHGCLVSGEDASLTFESFGNINTIATIQDIADAPDKNSSDFVHVYVNVPTARTKTDAYSSTLIDIRNSNTRASIYNSTCTLPVFRTQVHDGTWWYIAEIWDYHESKDVFVSGDKTMAIEFRDDGNNAIYFDYYGGVYTGPSELIVEYMGQQAVISINSNGRASTR